MKCGINVFLEHALELGGDRGAHQVQRIDRKKRIPGIGPDVEALDEPLGLQCVELALVLDAGKCFGRRLVVGGLENAAEQDRDIFEFRTRALFDRRDRLMAEEGVRAAEIEQELRMAVSPKASYMILIILSSLAGRITGINWTCAHGARPNARSANREA
jgi:hypothetical protein